MLKSVENLFNQYIDNVTRYTINSVVMERGENPDDIYYICSVGSRFYVVLETDYIDSLADVLAEIKEKATEYDLKPIYWLPKKDSLNKTIDSKILVESVDNIQLMKDALIFKSVDSYLRYIIVELNSNIKKNQKYHPSTYSNK